MRSRQLIITIFDNNPTTIDSAVENICEFCRDVVGEHVEEVRLQEN